MAMAPDTSTAGLAAFLSSHASLLARLHAEAGAARWEVSSEDFAHALYRSASHRFGASPPGGDALAEYLEALHLEDLALACALRQGSAPAWEEFVAAYRPVLYAAARAIVGSAGEARARELADSLYAELYGLNRAPAPVRGHGMAPARGRGISAGAVRCSTTSTGAASSPPGCAPCWRSGTWMRCERPSAPIRSTRNRRRRSA